MKILIIRFSSIGDIVITSPVLRCVRNHYPNSEIHFLTKSKFSSLVEHSRYIDQVRTLDDENEKRTIEELQTEQYELVIDLHKNLRTWRIKRALKTQWYSYNKLNIQKWLFVNFKINLLPEKHLVDRYFDGIKKLGVENDGKGLEYFFPAEFTFDLSQYNLLRKNYIAIAIGGTYHTKQIPQAVLLKLIEQLNQNVVLLGGGESDAKKASVIEKKLPNSTITNLVNKLTLHESAFLIKHAASLISGDTGLMHIAAALSVPIQTLWGNTHPLFGMYAYKPAPESADHRVSLACNPCSKLGTKRCPKNHFRCMNDQNVEQILKNCLSVDTTQ